MYELILKIGQAIEADRKATQDLHAELREAADTLISAYREVAYDGWLAKRAYKPAAPIQSIAEKKKEELAALLARPWAKKGLSKGGLRAAYALCQRGFETELSPYTLEPGTEEKPHCVPKMSGDKYVENGAQAETVFALQQEATKRACIKVMRGGQNHLTVYEGEGGPPPDRSAKRGDPELVLDLASRAVQVVRALCPKGPLNNAVRYDADKRQYVYLAGHENVSWLNAKSETLRLILDKTFLPETWQELDGEASFLRSMAAMGRATYSIGGGVCAQLSHLTLGVLTLLAPEKTQLAVVYDGKIDHSYVVLCQDDTDWIVCDPWPTEPHVAAWKHTCFPRRNILNYFLIRVRRPVLVPYGVCFPKATVQKATQYVERTETNYKRPPYHQWLHTSNLLNDKLDQWVLRQHKAGVQDDVIVQELARARCALSLAQVRALYNDPLRQECEALYGAKPPLVTASDYGKKLLDGWA